MKSVTAILFSVILLAAAGARAGDAEVRNVALLNNCAPKKIEVYQQNLGMSGQTVYRVRCALPKMVGQTDGDAKIPDAILVGCRLNMCEMLRSLSTDGK